MKITEPNFYPDISEADYRSDPTPAPSLTQSLVKILLEKSPLHAWHANPRMNPDYIRDDDTKYDIGNITHKLLLGRGRDLVVLEYDDWRTGAAKEARKTATAVGKLAVLSKHVGLAERMVKAVREQLEHRDLGNLFQEDGASEVCIAWQRGGIWCRQLVDWLSPDRRIFVDVKTTDMSAAPHGLGRMMVTMAWPVQAAFAENGLDALDPDNAARRKFLFVVQETDPPHQISVVQMSDAAMVMGRKQCEHAFSIWAECLLHNQFPGYPLETVTPEYPGWAEQQWLDREIHDAARARVPQSGRHHDNINAG